VKRVFDVLISLFALTLFAPVMIIVAYFIKFESEGPAVFKQERVGINGKLFFIYKFRSMVIDSEKIGPYFTQKNDLRITRVGQFIRKTSLDETPQLFNVLLGDMSLVGPRPNVPAQKSEYSKGVWDKRNSIRPGITGLAQAQLRSLATPSQREELDLNYIARSSLLFDCWIILLTFKQVIFRRGN